MPPRHRSRMRSRDSNRSRSPTEPNSALWLTALAGLVWLVLSPPRSERAGRSTQKGSGNTRPDGRLLPSLDGRRANDVPLPVRKPPDALLYRYTASGVIAHTVVNGHEAGGS